MFFNNRYYAGFPHIPQAVQDRCNQLIVDLIQGILTQVQSI